ncbi:type I restriction endonuclease subunit R [Oceanivirga salmonicida]|uniref:type I restriction endonuclease subunit R n=1 Tax=Oceanivirga salmonicida TaxID=1769291 RepID=UPI0012E310A4|nr:type I restriction endonuclease subunit R [Oceanivirga salmonicida]
MEYKHIMSDEYSTLVAEYKPKYNARTRYQSEAELEASFISVLESMGYERVYIKDEKDLILNLRKQLSNLNKIEFTDNEWDKLFNSYICVKTHDKIDKIRNIQENHRYTLTLDSGKDINIKLIDKENIYNNKLQVLNQFEENKGKHNSRYDVTILVNGLPLVHSELKRRGVAIKEAYNQIKRYERESFWAGNALYEYVQIYIISNGTHTKYYSSTSRYNNFEFTSYWSDKKNRNILELIDFAKSFCDKRALINIITKYCVFDTANILKVMRPYQIEATESIIRKIIMSKNHKKYGTVDGGGYIWHTTGSGKTLTSFKTSQIVTKLDEIEKVIFVVDRKDLDAQTIREYTKFKEGCVQSNNSTRVLQEQLEDLNTKIVVTTIQKLSNFVKRNKKHSIYGKEVVMIFDECHRTQFGDMHKIIKKMFKKYYIFGFTGTPIFNENSVNHSTTDEVFGQRLHAYTIVNAIHDDNVLKFKVDYIKTFKEKEELEDKNIKDIDTVSVYRDDRHVSGVIDYIIKNYDAKTKRIGGDKSKGFNSILAVESIAMAKKYYTEFKKRNSNYTFATIFSYSPNEDENDATKFNDDDFDTNKLDKSSRDFLEEAIADYNKEFGTNFDTSSDKFSNYYEHVSKSTKEKKVDILIVVNMFLTGFDAPTLNTLWVDKNLKYHGLIQAFSRTNRIYNSVKTHGNIVCFRPYLSKNLDDAISLYGDADIKELVTLKPFNDYYQEYIKQIKELKETFPLNEEIKGDEKVKSFLKLFGKILRLENILTSFDEFEESDKLSDFEGQNYRSKYIDLRPKSEHDKEYINDDIVFETELISQIEVNIDYILKLVEEYKKTKNKEILAKIDSSIDSSLTLRSKKDLIHQFIEKDTSVNWHEFIIEKKNNELEEIIIQENLKPELTKNLLEDSFRYGEILTEGKSIDKLLPENISIRQGRGKKKKIVVDKLLEYFEKFMGIF